MQVDSELLKDHQRDSKLLFIGRPSDHTVDTKQDSKIIKSGLFGISGTVVQIETIVKEEDIKRILAAGGWVELHVVMLPKDITDDKISTLADVDRLGGKDMESRNFMIPVSLVAVPVGPDGKPVAPQNIPPGSVTY